MKSTVLYASCYLMACLAMAWVNRQADIPQTAEQQQFKKQIHLNEDSAIRTLTMVYSQ